MFSLGATFFAITFFVSPFKSGKASMSDEHYKHIMRGDEESFWKTNMQVQVILQFMMSQDREGTLALKNLIYSMLQSDVEKRPSIGEVLSHPWFSQ